MCKLYKSERTLQVNSHFMFVKNILIEYNNKILSHNPTKNGRILRGKYVEIGPNRTARNMQGTKI